MAVETRPFQGKTDIAEIARIFGIAFGKGAGEWYDKHLRKVKPAERKNYRCLTADGRIVSFLEVQPKRMHIGRALVRMAGIAAVCTDAEFRKKGYNRRLWADSIEFMEREGYDISILYGIPKYYHRYGYSEIMARHMVTMAPSDFEDAPAKMKSAALTKADMKAVCTLYNTQARFRDGNIERKSMARPERGLKVSDKRGRIAAYALYRESEGTLEVRDAAARDGAAARELLGAIQRTAHREVAGHIKVLLPPGYPLTDVMRRYNCVYRRVHKRNRGCMGRVTNMARLVKTMRPEWSYLVSRSEFAGANFELVLKVGDETLRISSDGAGVKSALVHARAWGRVAPERFMQMLVGYRAVCEVADESDVRLSRRDMRLVEVLFPERDTHIFAPDRF